MRWFEQSARAGFGDAQFRLALGYVRGLGVPENVVEAYAWLELSEAAGFGLATRTKEMLRPSLTRADLRRANQRAREIYLEINTPQ